MMAALRNSLIVDPWEFKDAFHKVVNISSVNSVLVKNWYKPGTFTKCWEELIYPKVARKLSLKHWRGNKSGEYWYLDAIFYQHNDKILDAQGYEYDYATFLTVAMEHENDSTTSYEEMNKLSVFNASLKVLITYPAQGDYGRSAWPSDDVLLKNYKKQIISADFFGLAKENKSRTMVIFGYYQKNGPMLWEYHLFNGKTSEWEKI